MNNALRAPALWALLLALALFTAACGDSSDSGSTASTSGDPASGDTSSEQSDSDTTSADASPSDSEPTEEPDSDAQILRVGVQFSPDAGLAIETDDASILVRAGVVEGLVDADATGQPVPALAESWERIDDTTWEFALRPDVVFHDGSPLDADTVDTALTYVSGVAAPPRSLGELTLSVEVVDDLTVRVITSEPDPILPLRLSSRSLAILAPAAYESTPTAAIGTGPFALAEFNPPDSLTVERFDEYWGEVAQLDGAEFRFIPDAGARAAAIRASEIDVTSGIAIPDLEAIEDDADISLIRFSLPRTATLYANTAGGAMADPTVREAVSLAVDEALIADGLLEGEFTTARSYFGPENPWAPQAEADPADAADQAAALVESIDADNRSINLWTYTGREELADMATVIQSQLEDVGFEVSIEVTEYGPFEERVFAGEHDLIVLSRGYYFDIADPSAMLTSDFTCEGGYNLSLYCDAEFDALMAEVNATDSPEDRQELAGQASQWLLDNHVGFPLVHDNARYAARSNVQGLEIDPFESVLLTPQVSLG
jgi:peptide/nickel transport system substrate-binding protein